MKLKLEGVSRFEDKISYFLYTERNCGRPLRPNQKDIKKFANIDSDGTVTINFNKLTKNKNERQYILFKDNAGNWSDCFGIDIIYDAEAPSFDSLTVKLGLGTGASFTEKQTVGRKDISNLKIQTIGINEEIAFYEVFLEKSWCEENTRVTKRFNSGNTVTFPINYTPKKNEVLTAYVQIKDSAGNINKKCVKSNDVTVDFNVPTNPILSLGKTPYGLAAFPKVTFSKIVNDSVLTNRISGYQINILDQITSNPVDNCSIEIPANPDGSTAQVSPEFAPDCQLKDKYNYVYSIKARDEAGNQSKATITDKWTTKTCPTRFVAINDSPNPFCVSQYEMRKSNKSPEVSTDASLPV